MSMPVIDYAALGQVHPSLARGRVWCRSCGHTQAVDSSNALRRGWPKCCSMTMTIDSPEEQAGLAALSPPMIVEGFEK